MFVYNALDTALNKFWFIRAYCKLCHSRNQMRKMQTTYNYYEIDSYLTQQIKKKMLNKTRGLKSFVRQLFSFESYHETCIKLNDNSGQWKRASNLQTELQEIIQSHI